MRIIIKMEILYMTMEDVDEIDILEKACFKVPWSRSAFIEELKNDMAIYFVAKVDGKCVGYCGFWNVVGEGHITNVAVISEFRKRGIASSLIENMIKSAQELNLSLLTLEVRESNIAAQSLYTNYGFKKIGLRKNYYVDNNENAWIMTKELV